jgi:hypothetical protein
MPFAPELRYAQMGGQQRFCLIPQACAVAQPYRHDLADGTSLSPQLTSSNSLPVPLRSAGAARQSLSDPQTGARLAASTLPTVSRKWVASWWKR